MREGQILFLTAAILIGNIVFSYQGFKNLSFQEKFLLHVRSIVVNKEYHRYFTSGFLHADWTHLIFNMMSFWFFANNVGMSFGPFPFMAIYVGSLLVGNLLAVQLNKSNFNYRALGASGAVAGIIFSSILVNPYQTILIFFIPMPAWLFAIGYVLFSIYGIKKQNDRIGHEAHLGGAITGVLLSVLFQPEIMMQHTWLFLALILPTTFFLFSMQLGWKWKSINSKTVSKKKLEEFRKEDFSIESEINYLLDKISDKGYNSLTEVEKKRLDQLSKKNKQ